MKMAFGTENNSNRRLSKLDKKQILKHAVASAEIIDRLIQNEKDLKKLDDLELLRKENAKIWPRLKA